jgi:hypothetical protein
MKRAVLAVVLVVLGSSSAWAQATRTWVSGVGADDNPCSRTAPCKTFAGAILKTAAGGEISVLDPGGYGSVNITKSITIDGAGTHASILASGTTGIIVNVAASDRVVLRNLAINGAGTTTGLRGIRFLAGGSLTIENCVVMNFRTSPGTGLDVVAPNSTTTVINSTFVQNTNGASVAPTSGTAKVVVENSRFVDNKTGVGLRAQDNATVTVRGSVASGNATGLTAFGNPGTAIIDVEETIVSNNTFGVVAGLGSGTSRVRMSNTMVTGNGTGLFADATGQVHSWGNNRIIDNTTNGVPNVVIAEQ